jgi:hypothetical protein
MSIIGNIGICTTIPTTTTASIVTGAASPNTSLNITANNPTTGPTIILNNDYNQSARISLGGSSNILSYVASNLNILSPKDINYYTNNNILANSFTILANGRVGIGTRSPSQLLDVYTNDGSINNYIRVRATTPREAGITFDRNGTLWIIFNKGTGFTEVCNLCFQSSSVSSALEITQSGNVCIGTTTTKSKFTVQGTANIDNGTSISRAEMMSAGSLTLGSTDFNFGGNFYTGGVWTGTNTAGLMMECSDNSEIAFTTVELV